IGDQCDGLGEESQMTGRVLSGRRIVVLGGTGGLGHAVVARFTDDGASVLVADARPPRDEHRQPGVDYVTVDARDEASVAAAFATSPPPGAVVNLIGGDTPPPPPSPRDIPAPRPRRRPTPGAAAVADERPTPQ